MLNMPILKFEKSCNYLNDQLNIQNNNKQLILDIISNIGLILNSNEEKAEQYSNIIDSANEFLKTVSSNITAIEQLNLEISNITKELTDILADQNKTTKTREFFIAAFSNIKHNVEIYSQKFQDMVDKLTEDNTSFNDFINTNNIKYNFVSIDDDNNGYTFTGFSIDDEPSVVDEVVDEIDDEPSIVDEIINEDDITTDELLDIISEDELLESISDEDLLADISLEDLPEESLEEFLTDDSFFTNELEERPEEFENQVENDSTSEEQSEEVVTYEETIEDYTEDTSSTTTNIEEEIVTDSVENTIEENDKNNKIDELTNEFKELLINLSESNLSNKDAIASVATLFNEVLPSKIETTTVEKVTPSPTEEIETVVEEPILVEIDLNEEEVFNAYLLANIENEIIEEHNKLTYIFDEETNSDIAYINYISPTPIVETEPVEEEIVEEPVKATSVIKEIFVEDTTDIEVDDNEIPELEVSAEPTYHYEPTLNDNATVASSVSIVSAEPIIEENNIQVDTITQENTIVEMAFADTPISNTNTDASPEVEMIFADTDTNESSETSIFETINKDLIEELSDEEILSFSIFDNYVEEDEKEKVELVFADTKIESTDDIPNNTDNDVENEKISDTEIDILDDGEQDINIIDDSLDAELLENLDDDFLLENTDLLDDINLLDDYDSENEDTDEVQEEDSLIDYLKEQHSAKAKNLTKTSFQEKLLKIQEAVEDNKTLLISERLQKIYLPYKISELVNYVESYPDSYSSLKDVVEQEFILPFDYFRKNPSKARFTETYNLLKNREGRNFMKSVSYAFRLLNKNNLNPAIIASCKSQHELDSYLYYLESDNLNNFKFFDIIYEVNPM